MTARCLHIRTGRALESLGAAPDARIRPGRGRSIGTMSPNIAWIAKRLLATGMCIKSVAYATGFTAPSNFTAAFVRATCETPRQYRQRASLRNVDAQTVRSKARSVH